MKISVPVIRSVDVLLLGGTLSGCRAAIDLKKQGCSVFCATPFSYFGEDICAYLNMQSEKSADYQALFGDKTHPTPMEVKHGLDLKMIEAGIEWFFQSAPVALARDAAGHVSGVVIANRSGFQLIEARCILDATGRSLAARLNGAESKPFKPGEYEVSLIQIGACKAGGGVSMEQLPEPAVEGERSFPVFKAVKKMHFEAVTPESLNRATVAMRRACWHPDMVKSADLCSFGFEQGVIAPDPANGILVPETFAEAKRVLSTSKPGRTASVDGTSEPCDYEVVRKDDFFRFKGGRTVGFDLNSIPVADTCDVLVTGAGTGGAPAGIAAAREGARTIVTETLSFAGGICTAGMICVYWYGNRIGFTTELDNGCGAMGPNPNFKVGGSMCNPRWKAQWLLDQADDAGAQFRFNTMTVGAVMRGNRVSGCIAVGPFGAGLILAKASVDATGNADLAAEAGGTVMPLVAEEPAVQGAGLAPVHLGNNYDNTDYSFVCDCDVVDGSRMFVMSRGKFEAAFDGTQILDTRERRRIIGDIVLQPQDFYANRCYSDTINIATSNFDTHGFIIHPMFMLKPTEEDPYWAKIPYRALLPRNLDGVLVTGLAVSAHRDCMPLIRMQPDVQNQGYAAGLAAAMSAKNALPLRSIELRSLQKKLIAKAILPESILEETDSIGGISADSSHYELASIFLDSDKAKAELHAKFEADPADVHTAHILAFLGDGIGRDLLKKTLAGTAWDTGWNYRGMGQFGFSVSPVDSLIFALDKVGGAKDEVLAKTKQLTAASEFSHIRTVCMSLIRYPDKDAAPELERMLNEDGVRGFAVKNYADALASNRAEINDTTIRNAQLRELYLAKALLACDPANPLAARIVADYAGSMQAYYAIFAQKA